MWQFRPPPGQEIWTAKEFCTITVTTKAGIRYRLFVWDWQLPQTWNDPLYAVINLQKIIQPKR